MSPERGASGSKAEIMIRELFSAVLWAWLLLYRTDCEPVNGYEGPYTIAFVSITTDDLQTSLKFYTQVGCDATT